MREQRRAGEKRESEGDLTESCYFNCFNSVLVMGYPAIILHLSCRTNRKKEKTQSWALGVI